MKEVICNPWSSTAGVGSCDCRTVAKVQIVKRCMQSGIRAKWDKDADVASPRVWWCRWPPRLYVIKAQPHTGYSLLLG